uniref:Uncharacterized protein n=1 Tax=Sphaerodactylus townsendi TaxID=933632 RepID=A0ACB8EH95_9SAUR
MKLYCKVVALALCLGILLLLYLFVGNADEPPLQVAKGAPSARVSSGPGADGAGVRPVPPAAELEEEEAAQVSRREPRLHKKPGKRSAARGKFASVRATPSEEEACPAPLELGQAKCQVAGNVSYM